MAELRRTKQRQAIQDVLSILSGFSSAKEIHEALNSRGESVGLSTVYRNLVSLSDAKEVDTIRSEDGEVRYRLCDTGHHHHHLVCENCRRTVEIDSSAMENWAEDVAAKHGFSAVSHTIEIFGVCQKCAKLQP